MKTGRFGGQPERPVLQNILNRNDKSEHITHLDNVVRIIIPWSEWNYRIQRSQNYKNDIRVVINQHFHQY